MSMRYFISIDITDEEVKNSLMNFTDRLNSFGDMKIVKPENLHITLLFLGEREESEIDKMKERFRETSSDIDSGEFECSINDLGVFPHINFIKVVWSGAKPKEEMDELHLKYNEVFESENEGDFVPHVTLGRLKNIGEREKRELQQVVRDESPEFGSFQVENVRLKESRMTDEGSVYRDVEVYGLDGDERG